MKPGQHIHFIGIGGAGLSALAHVMLGRGYEVSGSDPAAPNSVTDALAARGARIFNRHDGENIAGADEIVVTSAASGDNPEILAAHLQQKPILKRRDFLREVTRDNDVIAVAGSHGKTTTTAMIARILEAGGLDPTVVVGGRVPEWSTNARSGTSNWFVIEADEYDYAFLGLEPKIAVVTNVDYDHPDMFPTRQAYFNAFADFLKQTRPDGVIVVCGEEATATALADASERTVIRYGTHDANEWCAKHLQANGRGGTDFEILFENHPIGNGSLQVPGKHNVLNALAAIGAAHNANVSVDVSSATLKTFVGVGRRLQARGTFHGATIVDDYAHHPTEIRVSLAAVRERFPQAKIVALFQPHTFSRTAALLDEFANAFGDADEVIVTEIYAARETNETGLSSERIVERMTHKQARFAETPDGAENILRQELRPGDVLITLGAGDVNRVAQNLTEHDNA